MTVTAVIPAHLPRLRDGSLRRAVDSVLGQQRPVDAIAVAFDVTHAGAAATRQRALDMACTDWVAFLDSDDWWHPNHLHVLTELADTTGADYVYSWFSGNNPFPGHRGRQMNPAQPHHTTMTVMVRRELAQQAGFANHPEAPPSWSGEDWLFTMRCLEAGATFAGTGEITWHYGVDGANTSGRPTKWVGTWPQVDATIVTPHIPTRRHELLRALDSVYGQEVLPAAVAVAVDHGREGSAATRNRALAMARTRWSAFLDDDDELLPTHLARLSAHTDRVRCDVAYTGCQVLGPDGREIPLREEWGRFGKPFDPDLLKGRAYLPVTSMVDTALARQVGGFACPPGSVYDDWGLYLRLLDAGAVFEHVPEVTWTWHHHGRNTSGQPTW